MKKYIFIRNHGFDSEIDQKEFVNDSDFKRYRETVGEMCFENWGFFDLTKGESFETLKKKIEDFFELSSDDIETIKEYYVEFNK